MKVITNDKVYVQIGDITNLLTIESSIDIPKKVLEIYRSNTCNYEDNGYEFLEFNDKEMIEFFRKLDFIVDYSWLKKLNEQEVINYGKKLIDERNRMLEEYSAISKALKESSIKKISLECQLLEFKIIAVREYLWFINGYIEMNLDKVMGEIQTHDNMSKHFVKSNIKKNS